MSRIGRLQISVPAGVTVEYKDQVVTVKGPKGTLTQKIESKNINVAVEANVVTVTRTNENKETKSVEEALRENGVYISTTSGVSMCPLFANRRDTVIISPVNGRLKTVHHAV